ncbi:hypothetical protein, partial [Prevotellamassilia timonensis]|uniref:hypothetical protein n=1 Tax=Prevotellamassilia timonensis TaxID=1852370 RepID=UPI001F4480A4
LPQPLPKGKGFVAALMHRTWGSFLGESKRRREEEWERGRLGKTMGRERKTMGRERKLEEGKLKFEEGKEKFEEGKIKFEEGKF